MEEILSESYSVVLIPFMDICLSLIIFTKCYFMGTFTPVSKPMQMLYTSDGTCPTFLLIIHLLDMPVYPNSFIAFKVMKSKSSTIFFLLILIPDHFRPDQTSFGC